METEAGLRESFYGKLAAGRSLVDLKAEAMEMQSGEAAATERAVGALTGALQSGVQAEQDIAAYRRLETAMGGSPDVAFVERVRERMRRLTGEWKATAFAQSMTLTFGP